MLDRVNDHTFVKPAHRGVPFLTFTYYLLHDPQGRAACVVKLDVRHAALWKGMATFTVLVVEWHAAVLAHQAPLRQIATQVTPLVDQRFIGRLDSP